MLIHTPTHPWLKHLAISYVPGPSTSLSEQITSKLMETLHQEGHDTQAAPTAETDVILTTAAIGRSAGLARLAHVHGPAQIQTESCSHGLYRGSCLTGGIQRLDGADRTAPDGRTGNGSRLRRGGGNRLTNLVSAGEARWRHHVFVPSCPDPDEVYSGPPGDWQAAT